MKRILFACSLFIASTIAANAASVLTSIKPIQLITLEITKGVSTPEVLLGPNTSPHDYALKPSDVKKIRGADLVIWFGPNLEAFLSKTLSGQDNILTLSSLEGLDLREFESGHHDDDHHHGHHDPHFWLGYKPTLQVAKAISQRLAKIDTEHSSEYQKNFDAFAEKLSEQNKQIQAQLEKVRSQGYYVFHDAYGYFEDDFGLKQLGHFTVSPERKPGAKTLIAIRSTLSAGKARCVFSEPQFTPAVIDSVVRGSDVKKGVLDPLGSSIEVSSGGYFRFKQALADSFEKCLSR